MENWPPPMSQACSSTTALPTNPAPAASAAWPDANPKGLTVILFLLLIIAAIALGIVGFVVKGLLYLLIIGIIVFLADLIFFGARLRGGRRRPAR
jgi:hypothetical protein